MTGGQIVAEYLAREGVPYIVGVQGHGIMALLDAFKDRTDVRFIQVKHEQGAAHLADGYYRVSGKPLVVVTSIGAGAANTVVGVATAYVDSTAMVVITGGTQTYMYERGVLQEIFRQHASDFASVMRPIVKQSWTVERVDLLPHVLHRAFKTALTGRRGPVHIEIPMDVQAAQIETEIPEPVKHRHIGRSRADSQLVERAAEMLLESKRPVILAGGGVITADASVELQEIAHLIQSPVVTTMTGKGAFPQDDPLCGWHTGANGTLVGNTLTREADVILAVGCRFSEQTSSAYVPDRSFNIPPTRLIHVDVDYQEIGKNYPTDVGIVADAKSCLADLTAAVKRSLGNRKLSRSDCVEEIAVLHRKWRDEIEERWKYADLSISKFIVLLRKSLDRDAIVIFSAGFPQVQMFQEFSAYQPRTIITPGGFSTMGFTIPAAIGAKLAAPDTQVVGVAGDGDFLMTLQELAVAVENNISVLYTVLNSCGWMSIRDFQRKMFGEDRVFGVDFVNKKTGKTYDVDIVKLAEGFGCYAEKVEDSQKAGPAIRRALDANKPAVLDVRISRDPRNSGGINYGYWDLPIPAYLAKKTGG